MRLYHGVLVLIFGFLLWGCSQNEKSNHKQKITHRQSGAATSLDQWFATRMNAKGDISLSSLSATYDAMRSANLRSDFPVWKPIGPHNVGGRTLCLAFHPANPNIVYAGSASGGLWVTKTAGKGANAWERMPIGHPVLGVSSILIDPENPDRMWIGTGEMYSNGVVRPGTVNRFTRGTYGIGILRSLDGGITWHPSLDWAYGQMRGVQQLAMNPMNKQSLLAATSEGLFRSYDGGDSWQMAFEVAMAVDIYIHPQDTNLILLTAGSYFTQGSGLYRSVNGAFSFSKITNGFPGDYTGKAMICGAPSDPDIIYAYVADVLQGRGLFVSDNGGSAWTEVNTTDVTQWQGWYSHDLAVHPDNVDELLVAGIDVYRSSNAGGFLIQQGIWEAGAYGKIPAGGPEGPPYYVHADVHGVYYHPLEPGHAWFATDGGIFVSEDGGFNFEGRNGGYQTQQFYARFSNSGQSPDIAMGGLQDNATVIYEGDGEWLKVIGGDGMSTAIDPLNDERMIASLPNLSLNRSVDQGMNFVKTEPTFFEQEIRPFNGAFVLDPQNPNRVLAGGQRLYRSDQFADPGSWESLQDSAIDGQHMITSIAITPSNPNRILIATSSDPILSGGSNAGNVFVSNQGGEGTNWQVAQGLPSRYCTSIAPHPQSSDTILATFNGFGAPQLYRSTDGGVNWQPWGSGLPDLPVNVVIFDPFEPTHLYLGNDLGVFISTDRGASWEAYSMGLPEACMVMDLAISFPKKVLRAATHGLGAYEVALLSQPSSNTELNMPEKETLISSLFPNPVIDQLHGRCPSGNASEIILELWSNRGIVVARKTIPVGVLDWNWSLPEIRSGLYLLTAAADNIRETHKVMVFTP